MDGRQDHATHLPGTRRRAEEPETAYGVEEPEDLPSSLPYVLGDPHAPEDGPRFPRVEQH